MSGDSPQGLGPSRAFYEARIKELEGIEAQQSTTDLVERLREVQVSYVPHAKTVREAADRIEGSARAFATLLDRIAELEAKRELDLIACAPEKARQRIAELEKEVEGLKSPHQPT